MHTKYALNSHQCSYDWSLDWLVRDGLESAANDTVLQSVYGVIFVNNLN